MGEAHAPRCPIVPQEAAKFLETYWRRGLASKRPADPSSIPWDLTYWCASSARACSSVPAAATRLVDLPHAARAAWKRSTTVHGSHLRVPFQLARRSSRRSRRRSAAAHRWRAPIRLSPPLPAASLGDANTDRRFDQLNLPAFGRLLPNDRGPGSGSQSRTWSGGLIKRSAVSQFISTY